MKTSIVFKLCFFFICSIMALHVFGQSTELVNGETQTPNAEAPVKLDGNILFNIRGVSALTAKERANITRQRIKLVAANENISTGLLKSLKKKIMFQL